MPPAQSNCSRRTQRYRSNESAPRTPHRTAAPTIVTRKTPGCRVRKRRRCRSATPESGGPAPAIACDIRRTSESCWQTPPEGTRRDTPRTPACRASAASTRLRSWRRAANHLTGTARRSKDASWRPIAPRYIFYVSPDRFPLPAQRTKCTVRRKRGSARRNRL